MTGTNVYVLSAAVVAGAVAGCKLLVPWLLCRFSQASVHPVDRADDAAVAYLVAMLLGGATIGGLSVVVMKLL
jgi:hypothetical protein